MEQSCLAGSLGRPVSDSSGLGQYPVQDGARHSRQPAADDISVRQVSGNGRSGHGPGHVRASGHSGVYGYTPDTRSGDHRGCVRGAGQRSGRQGPDGGARGHSQEDKVVLFPQRQSQRPQGPGHIRTYEGGHRSCAFHLQSFLRQDGLGHSG